MVDMNDTTHQKLEAALESLLPLRDLAKNWDVDIASCLEDYLQDIVGLDPETAAGAASLITSEGTPNFAQAAILLQNSTNVYSRKVEYLHALVYAALHDLVSSSTNAKLQKKKGIDVDIDAFDAFDPEVQFLLLDDIIPTDKTEGGDKINLKEYSIDRCNDNDPNNSLTSLLSRPSINGARLSLGGLSVTQMDDQSAVQYGNTAAAIRSLMSTLNRECGDTGGGNLRILSDRSDVNDKGILHLPGTATHSSMQGDRRQSNSIISTLQTGDELIPAGDDADMDSSFYNNADDNDGPGFDMNDATAVSEPGEENITKTTTIDFKLPPRREKLDPWCLLDPHDPESNKGRPLKIGITYKLPFGMKEPPSHYVNGASNTRKIMKRPQERPSFKRGVCIAADTFKATMANEKRRREPTCISRVVSDDGSANLNDTNFSHDDFVVERPNMPMQGLIFGDEFAYIAKAEVKRKATERRQRRKLLLENPTAIPSKEANALLGFDDHDDHGEDFEYGGESNDSFGDGEDGDSNQPVMGNTGLVSFNDVHATVDLETTNIDAAAFEALCRAHIRAFSKGAEKYAAETNLTKRVRQWQSRLAPILEEEEQRPEYDIHKYGERVIAEVRQKVTQRNETAKLNCIEENSTNEEIYFHSITRNCEKYEVCRLFLASLSLCNSGNVTFSDETGKVMTPDSLKIRILNSNVDRPMETYIAPSAATNMPLQ